MRYNKFYSQLRFYVVTRQVTNIFLPLLLLLIFTLSSCTIMDRLKKSSTTENKIFDDEVFASTETFADENSITDISIDDRNSTTTKDYFEDKEDYTEKLKKNGEPNITKTVNDTTVIDSKVNSNKSSELPIFGYVEYILLGPNKLRINAKLDTGAKTSSLNALDIVDFERDGEKWVKFNMIDPTSKDKLPFESKVKRYAKIKQHSSENQKRPVIMMEVRLGDVYIKREFSLTDRTKFIYQVLLGRNFLNGVALIDSSKVHLSNIGIAKK